LLLQCRELAVIDNLSGKLYLIVAIGLPGVRQLLKKKAAGA
jgi:hypothetical protein